MVSGRDGRCSAQGRQPTNSLRFDYVGNVTVAIKKNLDLRCLSLIKSASGFVSPGRDEETDTLDAEQDGNPATGADFQDVQKTLGGDGEAYRRIIERNQDKISAMMWRFSRDKDIHEELVQNVFVEAYLSLNTYKAKAPFAHWLTRIATRVGYLYWKTQARERSLSTVSLEEWHQDFEAADGDGASLESVNPFEAGELLDNLLGQLSPRDRLVLTLRYVEDYSVKETSRLTGLSQAMVKVQTLRARKKLKKLLKNTMQRTEL